jgi:hypothetical protein
MVLLFLASTSGHWKIQPEKRNPSLSSIWPIRSSPHLLTTGITPRSTRVILKTGKGEDLDYTYTRRRTTSTVSGRLLRRRGFESARKRTGNDQ